MNNESFIIPKITNLGMFDFKLKYGAELYSEGRFTNAYEIELPVVGGGLSYIDGEVYNIETDRLICAKPGQWRRTKAPFACMYIHIIPNEGEVCTILNALPNTMKLEDGDIIFSLFSEIITEYTRSAHTLNVLLYAKFLMLINELKRCGGEAEAGVTNGLTVNVQAVEAAINYMNENYMNKITLSDLSQVAHLSPIYLRKLFVDTVGMTPYEYILDKRIEKAKQLLAITNIAISDIAISCGFTDHAYMGKVFKEITGDTPLKYRKKQNEIYP